MCYILATEFYGVHNLQFEPVNLIPCCFLDSRLSIV